MAFMIEKVGRWTDEQEFKVEATRTIAYAAATNDPIAAHTSGELAPPVFAVVPTWDVNGEAVASVTPPEAFPFVLHGEQDIHIHRPIKPGEVLRSKAAAVGVHVKASGTTVVTRFETRAEDGELVNEQYSVTFFRGVSDGEGRGDAAPPHSFPEDVRGTDPAAAVTQHFDDDQTYRYSDASGDLVPIHLDEEFARNVGLPGIIIHGLCTMAFTSWAAIEHLGGGDPSRLKRLAVRFSKPVLPGEDVTTTFWRATEHDGVVGYAFESTNPAGDVVIKDGLAELLA
jgi:acyl dehydratase